MKRELNSEGCALLGRMIVEYAGRDYVSALRAQKANPKDPAAEGKVKALEAFFEGYWCEMLIPYDGKTLRERIKRRFLKDGCKICNRG